MAARMAPEPSQNGDRKRRARRGLAGLARLGSAPWLKLREIGGRLPAPRIRRTRVDAPPSFEGARAAAWTAWRPTPYQAAVGAVVLAVAFVATLTYYSARTFTQRATTERAANEAQSFTAHSATLANGDAFNGYIQILRYADDPVLNDKNATTPRRVALMRQDLLLNVNKFASLSIATPSGDVLASTDPSLRSVATDAAFVETRTSLNPANSDIVISKPGQKGYIEYSTPLHDATGGVWGILVARADPDRFWGSTLAATIDGGRNVIINREGLFAAGVPERLLGKPWRGSALSNGGVRANIAGVDSICGLAVIGKGTQIDKGLSVASCMPVSLIQSEQARAMGKQGLVTIAGAVLASVLAAGGLKLLWRGPERPRATAEPESLPSGAQASDFETPPNLEPASVHAPPAAESTEAEPVADAPSVAPAAIIETPPAVAADIDALRLIEGYEERNARMAERLRETVQARLLVATTQADEAFKLVPEDAEAAAQLHGRALDELERVRTAELRAVGQELYPALVRLGLPAALKALVKEVADSITVDLDVDATVDSVSATPGRSMLPMPLRVALYRFAADAVRALAAADAESCSIVLSRRDGMVVLSVSGDAGTEPQDTRGDLGASTVAIEAHGGTVSVSRREGELTISAMIAAPPVAAMAEGFVPPEGDSGDDSLEDPGDEFTSRIETQAPPEEPGDDVVVDPASRETEGEPTWTPKVIVLPGIPESGAERRSPSGVVPIDAIHLGDALESFAMTPRRLEVNLDLDLADGGEALVPGLRATVLGLVEAIARALEASGAARCTISVRQAVGEVMLSAISETDGTPFDAAPLKPYEAEIEAFGGYLGVSQRDNSVSVTAEVAAVTLDAAPSEPERFEGLLDGEAAPDDETLAS